MEAADIPSEPNPVKIQQDQAKQAQQAERQSIDSQYSEFMKKEQERVNAEMQSKAAQDFDAVRKLGFATQKDIQDSVESYFNRFVKGIEEIKEEQLKLREWVMRAKMQGLTSDKLEGQTEPERSLLMEKFGKRRPWY